MSSPATIRSETSTSRVPPGSRLIMGASFAGIRRKLPQALGRDCGWEKTVHVSRRTPLLTLQAALPTALFAGRCRGLAVKVLADLLVLLLNFAAVTRLLRLTEFAMRGDSSVLLPPLLFSGPDLGFPLLYGALVILLAHAEGLYRSDLIRMQREERFILARVVAWSTLLVGAAIWLSQLQISILGLAVVAPLNYLGMLGWRELRRRQAARNGEAGRDVRNVLIVGAGKVGQAVAVSLQHNAGDRVVLGFLDEHLPIGGNIRGRVGDLARIARAEFVDEIIFAVPGSGNSGAGSLRKPGVTGST